MNKMMNERQYSYQHYANKIILLSPSASFLSDFNICVSVLFCL